MGIISLKHRPSPLANQGFVLDAGVGFITKALIGKGSTFLVYPAVSYTTSDEKRLPDNTWEVSLL